MGHLVVWVGSAAMHVVVAARPCVKWARATAQGILAKMLQWKKTRAAAMLVMSPRQSISGGFSG